MHSCAMNAAIRFTFQIYPEGCTPPRLSFVQTVNYINECVLFDSGSSRVRRLKLGFDAGCLTHETILHLRDPHVVGGVLKSYLRELPEPLMTHSLYLDWMSTLR